MKKWYDEYISPQYYARAKALDVNPQDCKPSLTAEQFYLLRCNLLHSGEVAVSDIKNSHQKTPKIKLYFADSPTAGRIESMMYRGNDYEHPIEIGVNANLLCEYLHNAM